MRMKWCRHIHRRQYVGEIIYAWFFDGCYVVSQHWKVCPVCLKERPTKKNIKAAKLRAEMDGDL
jgi:ubiquitin C-terminal hydrolase